MLTEDDVIQQQELLKIYCTNLKHLVLQAAQHGGELVSPLDVINGINQARDNIARIKQLLRDNDVVVEDHPDDESSVRRVLDQAIDKQSSPVSQNDRSQVLRRAQLVSSILRGAQVLWVDDNPGYNIFERRLLRSLGIFVDLARSTEEALDLMADTEYDASSPISVAVMTPRPVSSFWRRQEPRVFTGGRSFIPGEYLLSS